jgi:hypothetical protein
VDIEVISVETHLQELDFKGSQADIRAFLEEQVSKEGVQFILALMVPAEYGLQGIPVRS